MKKVIDFIGKNPVKITAFICFIFYFLPFKPKPFGDGEYHEGTIQLIDYILNGFQGNVRVDKGLFTLFYYLIPYSLAYVFHNDTIFYLFGIIFNSLVVCLGIKYLFKAFDLFQFSDKSRFWSMMILMLFPIHAYYAMGILAESAAFFSVAIFLYFWAKIITDSNINSIKYYFFLALSLSALVGTRPNLIPFLLLFLIYILFLKIIWKRKIIFILTSILFFVSLNSFEKKVSPKPEEFKEVVFRNQIIWSRFELRNEPFNWLPQHGVGKFVSSDYLNNLKKRNELNTICEKNNYDKTQYFVNWVIDDIVQNPGITFRQYFLKFFQSQTFIISPLMKSNKSVFIKYGIHGYINSINYILIFFAIGGLVLLFKNRTYHLFIPFLFLWGWSVVYVFVFHSEQRYMFPIRPMLLFLFAYFINAKFENKKNTQ